MPLNLQPNLAEPGQRYFRDFTPGDDFYEALIEAHRDLGDAQSQLLNAKLVLLLANHIGDRPGCSTLRSKSIRWTSCWPPRRGCRKPASR